MVNLLKKFPWLTRRAARALIAIDAVFNSEWDTGVSVPGAFKLDHLQPAELILSNEISTFLSFILGSPIIYYPERGAWNEKRDSSNSEWDTGVSVPVAFKRHSNGTQQYVLWLDRPLYRHIILKRERVRCPGCNCTMGRESTTSLGSY